jgi:hypothetical protein
MDHRWGYRVRADLEVQVRWEASTRPAAATLYDLSVSGARLRADARPALLSRVRLCGPWDSCASQTGALEGFLVRHTPEGFALEWMHLAPADLEALIRTMLARYSHAHPTSPAAMAPRWARAGNPILVHGSHHALSRSHSRGA